MTGPDGPQILLVEDNPGDARLIREAFEAGRMANTLDVVPNGEEALDRLRGDVRSGAAAPDLVLLDLNLPGMSGEEVLEEIKGDPNLRTIPVIVLTSSDAKEDVIRSYEHHANAYLTKPVAPDEFSDLVRTVEEFWFDYVTLPPEGGPR